MYYLRKNIPYLVITLLILTGFSCSDNNGVNSNEPATIEGRVDGDQSRQKAKAVEGAVVTVGSLESDGSVSSINGAETETNASGRFNVNFNPSVAEHFIVTARNNAVSWKSYIFSDVENGANLILKPIDNESTAEANVFTELVSSGKLDGVSKADIETMISSRAAAEINSSTSQATRFASAIYSSARARSEFFANELQGDVESMRVATLQNLRNAQANLEANLNSSTSLEAYNAAYNAYLDARMNAYTDAGVSLSNTARSMEMESRVFLNSLTNVSAEAKESARAEASYVAALAIRKAVEAQAQTSNMSESSQSRINQAGVTLMSDIRAALGVKSEVEAAFQTYHDEVQSTMEDDSSIDASVIVSIDNEINASSGPKSILESGFTSVLSIDVAVSLYNSYYNGVQATVENNVDSTMSNEMVEILTDIMVLINLQS